MEQSVYTVDKRLKAPIIIAMVMGLALMVTEGAGKQGVLLFIILLPFYYLGAETLARSIVLDNQSITVNKFLRKVELPWTEIEEVDAVKSGAKAFLLLSSDNQRPVVIGNTLHPFREIVERIFEHMPPSKITAQARGLLTDAPTKYGPLVQAWAVCLVLTAMVLGRAAGY